MNTFSRPASRASWPVVGAAVVLALAGCGTAARPAVASAADSGPVTTAVTTTVTAPPATVPVAVRWSAVPPAPIPALDSRTGVWTGDELIVVGRAHAHTDRPQNHAAAYDPAARTWRLLPVPAVSGIGVEGDIASVWTGTEVIVLGGGYQDAYTPATGRWRHLVLPAYASQLGSDFALVWTGRQVVLYGGACCDSAHRTAGVYTPATDRWQPLSMALLGPRWTSAAWTGTEVVIAGGRGPVGGGTNATIATAGAYDPATGTWRRLPDLPAPTWGPVVWDGARVVVLGDGVAYAWAPGADRWTALPKGFDHRGGFAVTAAGRGRLVVWGGAIRSGQQDPTLPRSGLVFSPSGGWSALPVSPLRGRWSPVMVWTGRQVLVWGGDSVSDTASTPFADGAALTP